MTEHEEGNLDQFLAAYIGTATRDEVLAALREHEYWTLVIELEAPDGTTIIHLHGGLYDARQCDHAPNDARAGFRAHDVPDEPGDLYYLGGREQLRTGGPFAGRVVIEGATGILHMPAALERIDRFTDGFRLHLPGGMALGLVLWHDIHHVTQAGTWHLGSDRRRSR